MKYLSKYNSTIYTDEAILYGTKIVCFNILTIIMIIISSLLLSELKYGIAFVIFFSPMRIFNGGAHTKNPFLCLFLTSSLFLISLYIFKHIYYFSYYFLFLLAVLLYLLTKSKFSNKKIFLFTGIISLLLSYIFKDNTYYLSNFIAFYLFEILFLFKK